MPLRSRLEKLENSQANAARDYRPALITYAVGEQTKAKSAADCETENGPLSEYSVVILEIPTLPHKSVQRIRTSVQCILKNS